MKKLLALIFSIITIIALFSGCSRTKGENEPGGVTSNDGSLTSNISSMMDSSNISSVKDKVSSIISSIS